MMPHSPHVSMLSSSFNCQWAAAVHAGEGRQFKVLYITRVPYYFSTTPSESKLKARLVEK